MTRWTHGVLALMLSLAVVSGHAGEHKAAAPRDHAVIIYGKTDGNAPGWAITSSVPAGWTDDCCQYARAIGVNLVLYQGEWSGNPDRVMVLNVWPRKLPSLAAEWKADQSNYSKKDPRGSVEGFPVTLKTMSCHGLLYRGSDHIDDAVVFCDPGKATGIRLSWSMTVAADDAQREKITALFRQVVEASLYMKYVSSTAAKREGARP